MFLLGNKCRTIYIDFTWKFSSPVIGWTPVHLCFIWLAHKYYPYGTSERYQDESVNMGITKLIKQLECKGYTPNFNIMDDMTTIIIETFLESKILAYSFSHHMITERMQQREPLKCQKTDSLLVHAPPIAKILYNYGTSFFPRQKIHWTRF